MQRKGLYPAIGLLGTGPNATAKYCKLEIAHLKTLRKISSQLPAYG